jgi:ABC-2 type transport system ATP-binding protein
VIAVEHLSAARKPEFLSRLSLNWGPGVHGVIALPSDGVRLLSSVLAGLVRPASGKVTVLGASPSSPHVRRCIAAIPVDVSLPSRLNVEEIFRVADVLRGDSALREPVERLTTFGIERLLRRSVRSLSRAEVRAVAIAEALTAPSVKVLIVDDPLVHMEFRVVGAIPEALRSKSRDGCAVVVTTASLRDATAFADDFTFLRAGKVVDEMTSTSAASTFGVHGEMMAVMRNEPDARALATALVSEPDVQGFDVKLSSIVVRGNDPIALGRALGHAAIEANVDIVELSATPEASR